MDDENKNPQAEDEQPLVPDEIRRTFSEPQWRKELDGEWVPDVPPQRPWYPDAVKRTEMQYVDGGLPPSEEINRMRDALEAGARVIAMAAGLRQSLPGEISEQSADAPTFRKRVGEFLYQSAENTQRIINTFDPDYVDNGDDYLTGLSPVFKLFLSDRKLTPDEIASLHEAQDAQHAASTAAVAKFFGVEVNAPEQDDDAG